MNAQIVSPQPAHVAGLARLSRQFAAEHTWAAKIPIGQITTRQAAQAKLFGPDVVQVMLAEDESGKVIGYVGVYTHQQTVYISILIASAQRRQGIGQRLVEAVFERLSSGLVVQSWVLASNEASLAAMGRFGFTLERAFEDGDKLVHIFTRQA